MPNLLGVGTEESPSFRKKGGLARRLLRAVGAAGSSVGEAAGDLLKSAGKSARDVGGRASLTLSPFVSETPECSLLDLAEMLTSWLLAENQGKAELQQQRPSTVELTELGQVTNFYEVRFVEPGLLGRSYRVVLRQRPLSDWPANLPDCDDNFHAQALLVLEWPSHLITEPTDLAVVVWDNACVVGSRNSAVDLLQRFVQTRLGGCFAALKVVPAGAKRVTKQVSIVGRDEELVMLGELLPRPRNRARRATSIVSLAAPGGTGKSYFLKALRGRLGSRVAWASVDHQVIEEEGNSLSLVGGLLIRLARQLEEQGINLEQFGKEALLFRKRSQAEGADAGGGVFSHLRKAAHSAAGANPMLSALSAGLVFVTSWGLQAREESEALAKDNALKSLTESFKKDLIAYAVKARQEFLCWVPPVLVFDTYEWLAPLLDVWMRTEFLSLEFLDESGATIILAGREHLLRTDTRWSEWQGQTLSVGLKPMDRASAESYLQSLGVSAERFDDLYELTDGLPLFLNLCAHIESTDSAVSALVTRVLEEVPESHHALFLRASQLDHFDKKSLKDHFSDLSDDDMEQLTALLFKASFTLESHGKRAFIPPVRRIFRHAQSME